MAISIIQVGLGPIGLDIIEQLVHRPGMELVGAVDIDDKKIGRKLSEIYLEYQPDKTNLVQKIPDLIVHPTILGVLSSSDIKPTVAIHTTSSFLSIVTPNILEIVESGFHVVSTTEELAYPWWHHPSEAKEIDNAAKRVGVTVLGVGVNPGFVMDLLPVCLSGVSGYVDKVEVERFVDASPRRVPLKKKIGAGITVDEFKAHQAGGKFGHIGLVESVAMIGAALGWELKDIASVLNPILAESLYKQDDIVVKPENVLGIDQIASGVDDDGNERVKLHLQMYLGAPDPHDKITIIGYPSLEMIVKGGIPGDIATVSAAINAVPRIVNSTPGLKTSIDLPVPRWRSGMP